MVVLVSIVKQSLLGGLRVNAFDIAMGFEITEDGDILVLGSGSIDLAAGIMKAELDEEKRECKIGRIVSEVKPLLNSESIFAKEIREITG